MSACECLILGPEGSGKTTLLKKLKLRSTKNTLFSQTEAENDSIHDPISGVLHTVSTAGTNIEKLQLGRSQTCVLRECGYSIAPLWSSYYKNCSMIIYVVDTTNQTQISAATILLLDILTSPELQNRPILCLLNKTDSDLAMSIVELKSVMRLDELVANARQAVAIVEGSCVNGTGLEEVVEWIIKNSS